MFNVRKLIPGKIPAVGWLAAAVLCLLLAGWGIRSMGQEKLPNLAQMKLDIAASVPLPAEIGEQWQPGAADAEGYVQAADNEQFTLYVNPAAGGGIAVRNKRSGFLWRSSPPAGELADEQVKGLLLSNLKSPFILEYHEAGKTQRQKTNAADKDAAVTYRRSEHGMQVNYSFAKLNLSFGIQYQLTAAGLEVSVPSQGILEAGTMSIVSLQLLPYFGAARNTGDEGYLFVPDGPGGLIYYDSNRNLNGQGYRYPLYGSDLTGTAQEAHIRPTAIGYPVFGLKRGDEAFVAIMKTGQFESYVSAQPAGMVSGYNAVSAEWVYRKEYGQRLSKLSPPVNTIERERLDRDRTIEYRLLSGSGVGYVEMAAAYRSYLQQAGLLSARIEPGEAMPMELTLLGGNSGEAALGSRYAAATTFKQAEAIVGELREAGAARMNVTLQGWEQGGARGQPAIFPVEQALGGNRGAADFIGRMHEYGYKVLFEHDFVWYDESAAGISARTDGIRSMDGTVRLEEGRIVMVPERSVGRAYQAVDELKLLGADGIVFRSYGDTVYRDRNPANWLERDETAALFGGVMKYARQQLGEAAVEAGSEYTLSTVDRIVSLPFESSYDLNVDETVPFYPIVLHGLLPYSFSPGNLRDRYDEELLKAIEYGAVPAFVLTYEPSITIRYTLSNELFSTHYAKWKDRVLAEYRKFAQLSDVYDQPIVGHRQQAEGVYVTAYANGTEVTVDYNSLTFQVDKQAADADSR